MYRQGLGDCFLITIPRRNDAPFYMLIDCGVILGTSDPTTIMTNVVKDIFSTTGGHLDVLAATHEHWDHVSGFVQVKAEFQKFKIDKVWLGWTEDPDDELAKDLSGEHMAMKQALNLAAMRLGVAGDGDSAEKITGLMEFFGARSSGSTRDAMEILKNLTEKENVVYLNPQTSDPLAIPDTDARIFVLGPPHDLKKIKKINPSKKNPETYGMADGNDVTTVFVNSALENEDPMVPFDGTFEIPLAIAEQLPFFQTHYWGEPEGTDWQRQDWRRIDGDWLQSASDFALALDSATNNTSLVLALEIPGGDVVLFAADAQVGNWLSWQDLKWTVNGKEITGPDLIERTILYKVGHHGSHNATLREEGLEKMENLKMVMLPVDQAMAIKKRWGKMPLDSLLQRLKEKANNFVLRIDDKDVPEPYGDQVTATDLYYEITL